MVGKYSILCVVFFVFMAIFGFWACSSDTDDELRGRWQFSYCEYPAGGTFACDSAFYSFDRGVFQLQKLRPEGHGSYQTYGNYVLAGDSLILSIPRLPVGTVFCVPPFDWGSDGSKRFLVGEISRRRLMLSCRDTVYHFRKF